MAKDIMQIMERKDEIAKTLYKMKEDHKKEVDRLAKEYEELHRLEMIFEQDLGNIHFIQIAESLLTIRGDGVDKLVGNRVLTEAAAMDIAKGCPHLKREYYGNKRYEGYYQAEDHKYGYGPRHGYTVDEIGLRNPEALLTTEQSEACIYYLKNYSKIKALKLEDKIVSR